MMPPVSDNTALLLDIDGTLLDLARTPDSVKVPQDLVRALENPQSIAAMPDQKPRNSLRRSAPGMRIPSTATRTTT